MHIGCHAQADTWSALALTLELPFVHRPVGSIVSVLISDGPVTGAFRWQPVFQLSILYWRPRAAQWDHRVFPASEFGVRPTPSHILLQNTDRRSHCLHGNTITAQSNSHPQVRSILFWILQWGVLSFSQKTLSNGGGPTVVCLDTRRIQPLFVCLICAWP